MPETDHAVTDQPPTDVPTVTVGLVADPGIATKVACRVAAALPGALARATDHAVDWRVETRRQALGLDDDGQMPMLRIGREQMAQHGWDVVVLVTDLPRRIGDEPLVSDYGVPDRTSLISLPALGAVALVRRARELIVHLLADQLLGAVLAHRRGTDPTDGASTCSGHHPLRVGLAPVRHIRSTQEDVEMHLALTGLRGRVRLLVGMVRTNRPWRLVPNLSPALAGAAAGAAFGIFYTSIWPLADAFRPERFVLVNAFAVLAMSIWLIANNQLWQRPSDRTERGEIALFNTVTALTIGSGVACMYAALFVVTLVAAYAVIPPDYLATTLAHAVGPADFAAVSWLAASLGTLAGALGSGLADRDAVLQAVYSKREQQRRRQMSGQQDDGG